MYEFEMKCERGKKHPVGRRSGLKFLQNLESKHRRMEKAKCPKLVLSELLKGENFLQAYLRNGASKGRKLPKGVKQKLRTCLGKRIES